MESTKNTAEMLQEMLSHLGLETAVDVLEAYPDDPNACGDCRLDKSFESESSFSDTSVKTEREEIANGTLQSDIPCNNSSFGLLEASGGNSLEVPETFDTDDALMCDERKGGLYKHELVVDNCQYEYEKDLCEDIQDLVQSDLNFYEKQDPLASEFKPFSDPFNFELIGKRLRERLPEDKSYVSDWGTTDEETFSWYIKPPYQPPAHLIGKCNRDFAEVGIETCMDAISPMSDESLDKDVPEVQPPKLRIRYTREYLLQFSDCILAYSFPEDLRRFTETGELPLKQLEFVHQEHEPCYQIQNPYLGMEHIMFYNDMHYISNWKRSLAKY